MSGEAAERPVVFWDCSNDAEVLYYSTKKEAIESHLDDSDKLAGKITVYGYARMVIPEPTESDVMDLVEEFFEGRWEEYVGEDAPDITDRMQEAAQQFFTVMREEFVPWACEQVTSEEVDVLAWIKENRPDWLEEK